MVASWKVRSPEPEVSCILISCLPGCGASLLAVGDIASACPGMILIREVADAPVIMGISKPADLKSTTQGGEKMNPLFVGIDVSSKNNVVCLMKPDGTKFSTFSVQNNLGGARILSERIVSVLDKLRLSEVTIGMEATSIYGDSLVYALREDGSFSVTSVISMFSTPSRFANSRMRIRICPRMTMWMPSSSLTISDSAEFLRRSTWMTTATAPCKP